MSTPYFATPERIAALALEAARWPRTPFALYGAVAGAGGGASCHCLVGAVLRGAGWEIGEPLPRIRVGRGISHVDSVMLAWLRARPAKFAEVVPAELEGTQAGDVLVARLDLSEHHMGVVVPGDERTPGRRVLHTLKGAGAHWIGLADPALGRVTAIFRPLEAGA